jgi:endonuclease/exonuclease/phosphatase family metal-dependent hydrolase
MLPLKIITWNIEHFSGHEAEDARSPAERANRLSEVIAFIKDEEPDIFGISEVTSGFVYEKMVAAFPRHTFHITTGRQSQEILIGVRDGLGSFFTQKDEFKRNNVHLRPGALLTVHEGGVHVPILFVHLKSMPDPEGFGLRDAMLEEIYSLKRALDKAAAKLRGVDKAKANFIVLGDYNTMGLEYHRPRHNIAMADEIATMTERMARRQMRKPVTSHPHTFFNGSESSIPPSELDHVFVADHMQLDDSKGYEVEVGGWAKLTTNAARNAWIRRFSDHAPLIFTVTGVA